MKRGSLLLAVAVLSFSGCVSVFKTPPEPPPAPIKPTLVAKPGLPAVHTVLPTDKAAVACLDRPNLNALLVRLATLEQDDDYVRCANGDKDSCTALKKFAPAKPVAPAPKK